MLYVVRTECFSINIKLHFGGGDLNFLGGFDMRVGLPRYTKCQLRPPFERNSKTTWTCNSYSSG